MDLLWIENSRAKAQRRNENPLENAAALCVLAPLRENVSILLTFRAIRIGPNSALFFKLSPVAGLDEVGPIERM